MLIPRAAGAELAIYTDLFSKINTEYLDGVMGADLPKSEIYRVSGRYRLNMGFDIIDKRKNKNIASYYPDEKIWWLTAFNPKYDRLLPCEIKVIYRIDFSKSDRDKKMFEAFMGGIEENKKRWEFDMKRYIAKLVF